MESTARADEEGSEERIVEDTPDFEKEPEEPNAKGLEDEFALSGREKDEEEEMEDERILRLLPVREFTQKNSSLNKSLVQHLSEVEVRQTFKKQH